MKYFPSFPLAAFSFCSMLLPQVASAQTAYQWNNHEIGTHFWSDPNNWIHVDQNDENPVPGVPQNPENAQIQFTRSGTIGQRSYTVVMDTDGDQRITGGLLLNRAGTTSIGTLTLDLDQNRLIVDGSSIFVYPSSSSTGNRKNAIITNGTLQLGDTHSASFIFGESGFAAGSGTNVLTTEFTETATFDTANTSSISISSADGSTRINNMRLDLAKAKLVSGNQENTLSVTESIAIAHIATGNGYTRKGEMNLGVISTLSVGQDLILGHTNRNSNATVSEAGAPLYETTGILTFSQAETQGPVTINIGRDLRMGVGASATGEILHTPSHLHLKVGSETTRGGVIHIGYKHITQAAALGNSTGSFVSKGGTLEAYLTEFRVGQNINTTESDFNDAQGTFDFRHTTHTVLDILGNAVIGEGTNAIGTVWLANGTASSLNLTVGSTTSTTSDAIARSLLNLDAIQWSVSEVLTIGPNGDLKIQLAENGNGGLNLLSSDSDFFIIQAGGLLTIEFNSSPSEEILWGLRMSGDQRALFESYLEANLIVATGTFGDSASVFTQGGYTYYGIAAIPEPQTLGLILTAGLGFAISMRRRMPTGANS